MPSEEEIQKMMQLVKIDEDPKGALIDHIEEEATRIAEIENQVSEIQSFVEDAVAMKIDGKDGESIKGDQGYTPIKGKDYFDGKDGYTPIKGKDYFDGLPGIDGVDGQDGADGKDGKDGESIKGDKGDTPKHEWDGVALRFEKPDGEWGEWVNLQGPKGRNGENGSTYSVFGGGGGGERTRPGGADKQVQFNDGGIFGTDADFTYDKDTNTLAISGGILSVNEIVDATWNGDVITLDKGGTGQNLNDPGADSLMGWANTDGAIGFWSLGNGLVYDNVGNSLSVDDTVFLSVASAESTYLRLDGTNDPITGDVTFNDDIALEFGSVASLQWDTADANANFLKLNLPTPGAVDLAGLMLGVGISGVDTALFNGITQTFLGGFNAADDNEYWYHTYNPTSGFGGTGGQAEWFSSGDMEIQITGSLSGTSGINVRPPTGSTKNMRVSYRGGVGGNCTFEFGEQGVTAVSFRTNASFDQSGWGVTTSVGRQILFSDSVNFTSTLDADIPVMTDTLLSVSTSLAWTTDHSEALNISAYGIRGGYVSNANFISSTFAMETDRAPLSWIFGPANCRQNASSQTNKTGASLDIYAGDGNILDSTSGIGGKIILHPGSQDDDNNGEPGRVEIDLPQSTAQPNVGGTLLSTVTEVGNVGTGEDTLITYSLPAFTLQKAGDAVRITAWGTYASNVNTKRVKMHFGGTATADTTALAINGGSWRIVCEVFRDTATTQKAIAEIITNNALLVATSNSTAPGETLSGAVTIKCTGEATSNNDIVQEGMLIEYLPANS